MIPLLCYLYIGVKYLQNLALTMGMFLTLPMVQRRPAPYEDEFDDLTDVQRLHFATLLRKHPLPIPFPAMTCSRIVDMAESSDSFRYVYFYCGDHLAIKETYSPVGFLLIREIFTPDGWCARYHFHWNGALRTRAILKDDELIDVDDLPSVEHYDEYGFLTNRVWSTPAHGSPNEEMINLFGHVTRTFTINNFKIAHFRMWDVCEEVCPGESHYCSVCLTKDDGSFIRLHKCCKQMLHQECFKEWTKKSITCPLCRFSFSDFIECN